MCGISAGTGAGDNTLALIMTRGLAEISRLVYARGGQAMTCMGLAGMGDLIATCTSEHSRNRTFGYEFAHGVSLDEYQTRTHMVVEGPLRPQRQRTCPFTGRRHSAHLCRGATLYNGVTLDRARDSYRPRPLKSSTDSPTSAERLLPWVPSKSLRPSFRPTWPTSRANSTRSPRRLRALRRYGRSLYRQPHLWRRHP
ncbi:MAG: NAD(P)H-dependent glycerol-3-phosphate dehydrogenase [Collinsella sp.]